MKKSKYIEASFTIELSLLMPFIIFLIWNLLFLSFYLYDHSTAMQGSYMCALRTERMLGDVGVKQREAQIKMEEAVLKKMACAEASPEYNVSEKDVAIKVEVSMDAPGSPLYESSWKGGHEMRADEWKPVKYIRNIRKAEGVLGLLKGED